MPVTRRSARLSRMNEEPVPVQPKKKPPAKKNPPQQAKKRGPAIVEPDEEIEQKKPKAAPERPKRQSTLIKKETKIEDGLEMEISTDSSSLESDDSDDDVRFEMEIDSGNASKTSQEFEGSSRTVSRNTKNNKKSKMESSDSSGTEDSEEEEEERKKKTAKGRRKPITKPKTDKGDPNWPKCRPASIAKKTGLPSEPTKTTTSLRQVHKAKPDQPWKKNLAKYNEERKEAKGERRMREFRRVAEEVARGRVEEMSYEDAFKIFQELKKAYNEGRKLMEVVQKEEKREAGEDCSSSEDEWEEMEAIQPIIDNNIEVTLKKDDEDVEKDWWAIYLKQEVNKCVRRMWENVHKSHLVCYFGHLNHLVKVALDERLVPSLMVSQLPNGYTQYAGENIPIDVAKKLLGWYCDSFRPLKGVLSVAELEADLPEGQEARWPATSRLTSLIAAKCFETDADRAVLLFCLLVGMDVTARICVNASVISRKWDKEMIKEAKTKLEAFREVIKSRSPTPLEEKKDKKKKPKEQRNYWVEYWCTKYKKWITMDPLKRTVDQPLTMEENAREPLTYVFAIDNKRGIVEVTQRYALDYVKPDFRRRRTDPAWVSRTLRLPMFAANEQRLQLEKLQMNEELIKRPLPTSISEFKNHPLYVLEKDLLKFEAIYPPVETLKPLGEIRGHKVYPRSCVFTLQGELNWIKLARSVKIGEVPYKQVKARPNLRIPAEERVDRFTGVYGFWQTEPFRREKVVKGKIPRNEFGNVYMFQPVMCPIGAVHLKLPGLIQISRKLKKECVQAVVGWDFSGGATHPVMDGAIVLEEDVDVFVEEWNRLEAGRAEKEEKKRLERVYGNWKKIIKGMLRLKKVQQQFAPEKPSQMMKMMNTTNQKEKEEEEPTTSTLIDNTKATKPLEGFSLDDLMSKSKHCK